MPASGNTTLELRAGLFVLLGLGMIAYMVVQFGRFGTTLKSSYEVRLELPDASGLLKNSNVLLTGAKVGTVIDPPQVLEHARGVFLHLRIFENIQIPRNAQVVVGSSGLLGDRFVDVMPKAQDAGGYFQPGETIHGSRQAGLDELTRDGGLLVTDLRTTVNNLNNTITRVDRDLLKEETFRSLQESLQHLDATSKNFQAASEKLAGVMDEAHGVARAGGAVDTAKDALNSAKTAADQAQGAVGDVRKTLASVKNVTEQAEHGRGLIARLITDPQLADNLAALITNLRHSGVLFYKDRPVPPPPDGTPAATHGTHSGQ